MCQKEYVKFDLNSTLHGSLEVYVEDRCLFSFSLPVGSSDD